MSNLGNKIREIRLNKGLSQDAFAKELGYTSRTTINKIEQGVNDISFEKLQLLIKKFDVEIDELFDEFDYGKDSKVTSKENYNTIAHVKSLLSHFSLDTLSFKEIDENNFYDVCNLEVNNDQKDFVASNVMSLAEAYLFDQRGTWVLPLAIYNENELIGFSMITKGNIGAETPEKYENSFCILRMLIDKKYQGNGFGHKALHQIIKLLKSLSNSKDLIWVSTEKENISTISLYKKLGFLATDNYCGEELILEYCVQ